MYSKQLTEIIARSDEAWEQARKYLDWFEEVAANGVTNDLDSSIIARKACSLVCGELYKLSCIEMEEGTNSEHSPFNGLIPDEA